MTTTDFSTPCCKRHRTDAWLSRRLLACALALLVWCGLATGPHALAQEAPVAARPDLQLQLQRTDEGLYLSTTLQFALSELVEDALHKGIPMYFVAEAQVLRDRWYWADREVATATRYIRLSFQPLTRRWRLNMSSVPFSNSGLGVTLGQSFDEYGEALSAMQRIARWKVAGSSVVPSDAEHTVNFRFRLDTSQLPRPLQIGAVGHAGWSLLVSRSQRLLPEGTP